MKFFNRWNSAFLFLIVAIVIGLITVNTGTSQAAVDTADKITAVGMNETLVAPQGNQVLVRGPTDLQDTRSFTQNAQADVKTQESSACGSCHRLSVAYSQDIRNGPTDIMSWEMKSAMVDDTARYKDEVAALLKMPTSDEIGQNCIRTSGDISITDETATPLLL